MKVNNIHSKKNDISIRQGKPHKILKVLEGKTITKKLKRAKFMSCQKWLLNTLMSLIGNEFFLPF